ncbi:MAG: hypothetical protein M0P29_14300 [Sphaerochaetaceae bacterium]|nr:hypothetical protein [Sphaerochaetaceae bacterium]
MEYQKDRYELVLIVCDTDRAPHDGFLRIQKKLNEFHGNDHATDYVLYHSNPCIMQTILSHFGYVKLRTQSKSVDGGMIESFTGISGYRATKD